MPNDESEKFEKNLLSGSFRESATAMGITWIADILDEYQRVPADAPIQPDSQLDYVTQDLITEYGMDGNDILAQILAAVPETPNPVRRCDMIDATQNRIKITDHRVFDTIVMPLVNILRDDPDSAVKNAAAEALSETSWHDEKVAIPAVVTMIEEIIRQEPEQRTREAMIRFLEELATACHTQRPRIIELMGPVMLDTTNELKQCYHIQLLEELGVLDQKSGAKAISALQKLDMATKDNTHEKSLIFGSLLLLNAMQRGRSISSPSSAP